MRNRSGTLICAVVIAFSVWLAIAPSPIDSRLKKINQALATVDIDEALYSGFKEQVLWIAGQADIKENINVSQEIKADRLDIVVTHSRFTKLMWSNRLVPPS